MSFYVVTVGTPDGIKKYLRAQSEQLSGQSKAEFDAVLPAMETIVDQNCEASAKVVLHLTASGHAYVKDGVKQSGTCAVDIRRLGAFAE